MSFSRIGCKRWVRRPSSSIRRTARLRRAISRFQAARRCFKGRLLVDRRGKILAVLLHDVGQRLEVGREDLRQPLLLANVDHRDFDRAVQPRPAVADALQHVDGRVQHVVGGQHDVAEAAAGALDLLGGHDLFRPAEQGNLAHLHQVDADGVVDLVVVAGRLLAGGLQVGVEFQLQVGLDLFVGRSRSDSSSRRESSVSNSSSLRISSSRGRFMGRVAGDIFGFGLGLRLLGAGELGGGFRHETLLREAGCSWVLNRWHPLKACLVPKHRRSPGGSS